MECLPGSKLSTVTSPALITPPLLLLSSLSTGGPGVLWQDQCWGRTVGSYKRSIFLTFFALYKSQPLNILTVPIREDINRKKTFSFGHCPNHLNPPTPLTPIRATWSSFFSSVFQSQIQDLKVSLELSILYMLYNICNLKNS